MTSNTVLPTDHADDEESRHVGEKDALGCSLMKDLSPDKALIFRITHIANVEWTVANGLHCQSSELQDPNHVSIGNPDLIEKRKNRPVPMSPGGTLSDYVPFYFTPYSPMLYNIKTGWNGILQRPMADIVILVSSLLTVQKHGNSFLFTDRHANLSAAVFSVDLAALATLCWASWQARDFRKDHEDLARFERYQAEALVHKCLPVDALHGIVCYGDEQAEGVQEIVKKHGVSLDVAARPGWYF